MAIRLFSALMLFLSLALVFMSVQDFYSIELSPNELNFKNIIARNIDLYELNSTQIKSNYKADQWTRYETRDLFDEAVILGYDFNLSTKELVLEKTVAIFNDDTIYEDINKTKIEAKNLLYDRVKKELSTNLPFKAHKDDDLLMGSFLHYDLEKKRLNIQGVKAWLE